MTTKPVVRYSRWILFGALITTAVVVASLAIRGVSSQVTRFAAASPNMDVQFVSDHELVYVDRRGDVYRADLKPNPETTIVVSTKRESLRIAGILNSKEIVVGHFDGMIEFIDRNGKIQESRATNGGIITDLAFSEEAGLIAVTCHDGESDFGTGGYVELRTLPNLKESSVLKTEKTPLSVAWIPGGKQIIAGFYGGEIKLLRTSDLQVELTTRFDHPKLHRDADAISLNNDGSRAAISLGDVIVVIDVNTFEQKAIVSTGGIASCVEYSPVGKSTIAFAGEKCGAVIWNSRNGDTVRVHQSIPWIHAIDFSPNGKFLSIAEGRQAKVLEID